MLTIMLIMLLLWSLCWLSIAERRDLFIVVLSVVLLNVVMLNVVMLNVIMLNVVKLSVIMLNVVILNFIMLSVVILNVVAQMLQPCCHPQRRKKVYSIVTSQARQESIFCLKTETGLWLVKCHGISHVTAFSQLY